MDDLANGASNAPDEGISTSEAESSAPAPSAREALERAFSSVSEASPPADRGDGRDTIGRFAGKAAAEAPKVDAAAPPAAPDAQKPAEAAPAAPTPGGPPSRFTKAAAEAWGTVPEVVRGEVARLEAELTNGLKQYQERFEPIKRFDEMARQSGTSLDKALERYVNLENVLRQDPVTGVLHVFQNLGVKDPAMALNAIASRLGLGQLSGAQAPAEGGQADPRDATIRQLQQQIQQLGGHVQHVGRTIAEQQAEAAKRQIYGEVDSFAAAHPRFDELAEHISEMIETGYAKGRTQAEKLADAYAKADRLNPAPAAPVSTAPAAPQTRKAGLTITGSPATSSGSNPTTARTGSTRDALRGAFAQVGLS